MSKSENTTRALIVGGGGHACVLYDALRSVSGFSVAGFVAPQADGLLHDLGVEWLGEEPALLQNPTAVLGDGPVAVAIGIGDNSLRQKIQAAYAESAFDFIFPAIAHARSYVAVDASLDKGSFVAAGAVVGASARIGEGALVNVNAVVDHHCKVEAFASLGQGASMGGGAHLGLRSVLGVGASLAHARRIGDDTVVEGGACVLEDLDAQKRASGVPARVSGERNVGDRYL